MIGKKYLKDMLDYCFNIYNFDISCIYEDLNLDQSKNYYVYLHLDPTNPIENNTRKPKHLFYAAIGCKYLPFYVGKGSNNRAYDLNRNELHRKIRQRIRKSNNDVEVFILKDNLTELEALCLESKLIDIMGLKAHYQYGLLVNLDEGYRSHERRQLYIDNYKNLSLFNKHFEPRYKQLI